MRSRRFPPYPKNPHKTGQARIAVNGRHVYLGQFGSDESWLEYRKLMAEWQAGGERGVVTDEPDLLTIAQLAAMFTAWIRSYYRGADGKPSGEVEAFRLSLQPLLAIYGAERVATFGPLALKAVREAMIDGGWMPETLKDEYRKAGRKIGLARKVINQRVNRIRRMFRWGVSEELVSEAVLQRLTAVSGLAAGRSRAREKDEIEPVPLDVVRSTLLHLGPVTSAMVRVQMLSGMRPGELCRLTPAEIDRSGIVVDGVRVWVHRPTRHKNTWRGHKKAVVFGPTSQASLAPFLDRPDDKPLFSPAEEMLALTGRPSVGRRAPGDSYKPASYGKRIRAVCRSHGIPHWHPHQLRHLAEVEYERAFDLDTARAMLGHRDPRMSIRYGQQDLEKAARAAAKIG